MMQATDFMDVADSDFLSDKDLQDDSSDSSDCVFEKYFVLSGAKNRLFGRKRPLHVVLGSGAIADIILWRDKQVSACILVAATLTWFLFMGMGYTLLTFICYSLLLLLSMLFLWNYLAPFTNLSPPELSEFILPERLLVNSAISMCYDLNQVLITFGVIASGQDFKKFLLVTVTLGTLSVLGYWFTVATLLYIGSVILLTVPPLYEKHQDIIDIIAEKALAELNNQYAELLKKFRGNSQ